MSKTEKFFLSHLGFASAQTDKRKNDRRRIEKGGGNFSLFL